MGSAVNYSIVLIQKDFTKQIYKNMTSDFALACALIGFFAEAENESVNMFMCHRNQLKNGNYIPLSWVAVIELKK